MKGYELKMSGSRVGELLSRQFVVPTLDVPPTSETLSWEDGKYTVTFRIGELCRVQENGEWKFYRLQDVNGNIAFWVNANASEAPDLSNYYTKEEVDEKVGAIEIPEVELDDYYTKDEVDNKIEEGVSGITFPEDESIKNLTQDEYDAMKEADLLSDKTLYFVSKDGSPVALYIGKVQIAVREEGSKGFAYNFPIIF
jgi:hypothetical protein